ncbi:MAG: YegP family protein [Bacteroidia bacterium]
MFEIYQSEKSKEYYFRLKARNGQVILTSEGYSNKSGAQNGIESVKKNAGDDNRYERKVAANGKHHFNLKAANGQVIGSSQMYASKDSMENGIESVKKNAADGSVKDLTA